MKYKNYYSMKKIALLLLMATGIFGASAQYQQVKLSYDYKDLEPYIDSTTMRIHYSLHHAGYTKNLNKALENSADLKSMPLIMLLKNINSLPQSLQVAVRNNGGGLYNHNLYFENLTPASKSKIPAEFEAIIAKQFGSLDAFKSEVEKAAAGRFGSGWAWVLVKADGKMIITTTANQDAPIMDVSYTEGFPILNIDVWEHAYYLKYQNKRPEYLKNFWKVVNWDSVYEKYKLAVGN